MDSDDDGVQLQDAARARTYTNEELDIATHGAQQAWLVKLPKFLIDRWNTVQQGNVEVGRLRIYPAENGKPQAVTVIVPKHLANQTGQDPIPNEYDLDILNQSTSNTFVFAEKKDPVVREEPVAGPSNAAGSSSRSEMRKAKKRVREPTLVAKIVHECSLKPDVDSQQYRSIMRARSKKANEPKRKTQMLVVSQAVQNQMASGQTGARSNAKYNSFINVKNKTRDRLVRRPQNEVRDTLFEAFEEHRYWSLKSLKERTEQPETYLRELLADIAQQSARGPYAGLYSLLPVFQRERNEASAMLDEVIDSPDVAPSPASIIDRKGKERAETSDDDMDEG